MPGMLSQHPVVTPTVGISLFTLAFLLLNKSAKTTFLHLFYTVATLNLLDLFYMLARSFLNSRAKCFLHLG